MKENPKTKHYHVLENKVVTNDNKILIESTSPMQLNNVAELLNSLHSKLQSDPIGCFTRFKLDTDIRKQKWNIVFVDVNDLKVVNDSFGHKKGDMLLTKVVKILKIYGNVYRQGGDEFIILIDDETNLENFITKYETTKLFSFGIAKKNEYELSSQGIKLADERMYQQKKKKKLS